LIATVTGYDEDGAGHVYVVDAPDNPKPVEHHAAGAGITWGGQREFVDRLLQGFDARVPAAFGESVGLTDHYLASFVEEVQRLPLGGIKMQIPLGRITLQGSVELAGFLVERTITAQRFIEEICGVGGSIRVATLTAAEGLTWVRGQTCVGVSPTWNAIIEVTPAVTYVPADGITPAHYSGRVLSQLG
jgi:hypothetical protein